MNKEIFEFLSDLERNNNREWFAQNKKRYENAKKTLEGFVTKLILNINSFDPSIDIKDASKTFFRIYRDTRFSPNKTPYKINFGSIIVPESYRHSCEYPAYYLHLQNNDNFVSMGIYMPGSQVLKQVRNAIDEDFETFSEITGKLENSFGDMLHGAEDSLKRVPPGFDKNSPAAEYLKLKNFYVYKGFSNAEVLQNDFLEKITSLYIDSYELKKWFAKVIITE
ncbi:MAG: DUF2461 domain-containing protein [Prevotellaceae bacterium]|jgi:uncharacterized protein (TIGR02453 family)|nr:DUF2461 domain-containing protein [Prevotellaceae bacterium]